MPGRFSVWPMGKAVRRGLQGDRVNAVVLVGGPLAIAATSWWQGWVIRDAGSASSGLVVMCGLPLLVALHLAVLRSRLSERADPVLRPIIRRVDAAVANLLLCSVIGVALLLLAFTAAAAASRSHGVAVALTALATAAGCFLALAVVLALVLLGDAYVVLFAGDNPPAPDQPRRSRWRAPSSTGTEADPTHGDGDHEEDTIPRRS